VVLTGGTNLSRSVHADRQSFMVVPPVPPISTTKSLRFCLQYPWYPRSHRVTRLPCLGIEESLYCRGIFFERAGPFSRVAGQYCDEDGDRADHAARQRRHCRPHRTVAVEKGMIRQSGSGSTYDERLQCKL